MQTQIDTINEIITYCSQRIKLLQNTNVGINCSVRKITWLPAVITFTIDDFDYEYRTDWYRNNPDQKYHIKVTLRQDSPCQELLSRLDYDLLGTYNLTRFDRDYDPFERIAHENGPIERFMYDILMLYGQPHCGQEAVYASSKEWLERLYLDMEYLARVRLIKKLRKKLSTNKQEIYYTIYPERNHFGMYNEAFEPIFLRYLNTLTPITEDDLQPIDLHVVITHFVYDSERKTITPSFLVTHNGLPYYPLHGKHA